MITAHVLIIGNEIFCAVGIIRVDILLSKSTQKTVNPIELKTVEENKNNIHQIQRYTDCQKQQPNRLRAVLLKLIIKKDTVFLSKNSFIRLNFNTFDAQNSTLFKTLSVIKYENE